ncbi:MAG TPA: response regulator [Ferruginibacter sp.]|nr:response regulator [Ferruginibacter sp.]
MINNEIIRVLLADDDKDDRTDFIEAFESLKIKTSVQNVKNGIELMKYLNDPSAVIPHLLFLDLNMPKKSGLECLIEIKQMERLKNLTVVIYSTSSSEKDIEDTFINGANVYLKKPAHLTVLKKALLHVLTINWQYHTSGLNRDNFLLQI